jgi:hypothetical protein
VSQGYAFGTLYLLARGVTQRIERGSPFCAALRMMAAIGAGLCLPIRAPRHTVHGGCAPAWHPQFHFVAHITERSSPLAASRQGFVPAAARRCSGFHTGAPQRESPLAWNQITRVKKSPGRVYATICSILANAGRVFASLRFTLRTKSSEMGNNPR